MFPGALTTFRFCFLQYLKYWGSRLNGTCTWSPPSSLTSPASIPGHLDVTPVTVSGRYLYLLAAGEHIKVPATQHGHRGFRLQALPCSL